MPRGAKRARKARYAHSKIEQIPSGTDLFETECIPVRS
ncbi:hypothetical protein SJ05684_c17040 [Sinorhizobium sojae CCBAU 05684]|uniref:Uncharacterized protein n=1 Tax=Sinorhizobium sojae CCBAU 05684 TaxID=716928 RepID=A0A249PBD4_9HYPH|nr:hypothetical protein SJ05684_c17040 [Sinorhizobium sojae CCBAU 05684]